MHCAPPRPCAATASSGCRTFLRKFSTRRPAQTAPPSVQGSEDASGEAVAAALNLPSAALRDAECAALLRELERMHWNISRTAQALGISRNTLYRKIHKHNIVLEQ